MPPQLWQRPDVTCRDAPLFVELWPQHSTHLRVERFHWLPAKEELGKLWPHAVQGFRRVWLQHAAHLRVERFHWLEANAELGKLWRHEVQGFNRAADPFGGMPARART